MMLRDNGEWLTLAGTPGNSGTPGGTLDPETYRLGNNGDWYVRGGVVTSGKITKRWARCFR